MAFIEFELQEGVMPVRFLNDRLQTSFTNTIENVKNQEDSLLEEKPIQVRFQDFPGKLKSPVAGAGYILIQEVFLSYLWCNCYGLPTILSLMMRGIKNLSEQELSYVKYRSSEAELVWAYSLTLVDQYNEWNTELPNPELITSEVTNSNIDGAIERTNIIYLVAANFVLAHEFAHIELGHVTEESVEDEISIQQEIEADVRAIELVKQGYKDRLEIELNIGIMMGVCSLIFVSSRNKKNSHPDTSRRIDYFLRAIKPGDNDLELRIVILAYQLWNELYDLDLSWKSEFKTYKEQYLHFKSQVESKN